MKNKLNRDVSLDAVGGVFIVWMIITHAQQWASINNKYLDLFNSVLFIFMGWFYFKSGMFHHPHKIEKNIKKFIVPFLWYSALGELVYFIRLYNEDGLKWETILIDPLREMIFLGSIKGNLPLWFLLSLFTVKFIVEKLNGIRFIHTWLFLSFVFSYLFSIVITYHSSMPLYMGNVPLGLFFYLLGYEFREIQYNKKVFLISLLIFVFVQSLATSDIVFRSCIVIKGNFIFCIVSSVAGIVVFNNIFKVEVLRSPFFLYIGRNSMDFYCIHWILFNITLLLFGFVITGLPDIKLFWILIIVSFTTIPIYLHFKNIIQQKLA